MSFDFESRAVPYVTMLTTVERNGEWVRRAECPELPGCVAEAEFALEVLELLDVKRTEILDAMQARGETPPRPRPPLSSFIAHLRAVQ